MFVTKITSAGEGSDIRNLFPSCALASKFERLAVLIAKNVLFSLLATFASFLLCSLFAFAGGPRYVTEMSGTPITWTNGTIYYIDQGDLSPVLPGPEADAFVASAFAQWTAIPTAAVAAIHAGQLTENVSGANFFLNCDKSLHIPENILPFRSQQAGRNRLRL
jgi:hypothetical protein